MGGAAALLEDEHGGVVYIWGNASFSWDASDVAARRFAAVQLVVTKTAKAAQVARAFQISTSTLFRWCSEFSARGIGGLLEEKRGPKAQRVLDEAQIAQVKTLRGEGKSLREIAARLGCSTSPVRQALGLIGERRGTHDITTDVSGDHEPDTQDLEAQEYDSVVVDQDDTRLDSPEVHTTDKEAPDDDSRVESELHSATANDASRSEAVELVALALPEPRTSKRTLARFGLLGYAKPVFTQGAGLPRLGMLLVLPAIEVTGLAEVATGLYIAMQNGFYGLTSTLLTMVFLALAREPRAEGATRLPPGDLGRLLGLDRAPEVKTIRRKLAELSSRGLGSALQGGLAQRHNAADPQVCGYLYIDGHVRVYAGGRDLQKAHVTRSRIAAPATLETWVNDRNGDPVMVITAELSASLVSEIRRLLPELRALVGERHRVTIVFDRGGWSPELFEEILAAGFDFMTYRKGKVKKEPARAFFEATYIDEHGVALTYDLCDRRIRLRLKKRVEGKKTLLVRQVVRRSETGHQTQIVTSRTDIDAACVGYHMFNRWRQENYFRYARAHFALDGLDSYAAAPDDPERSVPNPARKVLQAKARKARADLQSAKAAIADAAATNTEARQRTMRGFQVANAELTKAAKDAEAELDTTPTRVPLAQVRPGATVLDEERKLLTHAIRMATYNAESALARILGIGGHFPTDEARALLREAFNAPGDLQVVGNTLCVRLDPLSAPRRTRALKALCEELTATESTYPGTDLVLRYSIKDAPGIA